MIAPAVPWARARLNVGLVGRLSVPYVLLAVGLRVILSGRTIANVTSTQTGDIAFYHQLAQLSDSGLYPFLHFWVEYPPVFPFLLTGMYRLLALAGLTSLEQFSVAYSALMSGIDLVNLVLVYRLVRRAHGERAADWAAVIYAGCPALIWFSAGWFDALAVLSMLLSLEALLNRRPASAGVLIALGVLTKIFPGVLLLAAPAALGWRGTARLVGAAAATVAAVLLPLLMLSPDLVMASFASMVTRGPWETLPALLNGYYGWGVLPQLEDRFAAAAAFATSTGYSPVTAITQAVILLAAWAGLRVLRSGRAASGDIYAVVSLGVITFVLGNKGFSPQFVAWLVPVILLVWPNKVGLLYVGLLSAHTLAYHEIVFPAMRMYYQDHQGTVDQVAGVVWASVAIRTALIAFIAGHLCCWQIAARRSARAWQ